jgi:steroid 5-alpha reductase family enzyme
MSNDERTAWIGIVAGVAIGLALGWMIGNGWSVGGLVPVTLAFVINWVAFVPAWIKRTEHFYDLLGGLTFVSVAGVGWALGGAATGLQLLVLAMVVLWAVRLAGFLFLRIRKAGKDARFDAIKQSFARFLLAWTLQGLWVCFTLAPALVILGQARVPAVSWWTIGGGVLWLAGFGIEVVADWQKYQFRRDPAHRGQFIRHGLWAVSRHPNYFGEIVLWSGMAVIALPLMTGWQYGALLSPVMIYLLLTRISGIPMLETRADATWGGQADYEAYKRTTPVLVPFFGKQATTRTVVR